MIVNKGFSFSNFIGKYKIVDTYRNDTEISSSNKLSKDDRYQFYTIDTVFEDCKLTEIYSLILYSENSIALEFAAIDIENSDSILTFCNKYGLVCSDRMLNNTTTDYIFFNTTKEKFAPIVPCNERDSISLHIFNSYVIEMRHILKLIAGINELNYVSIIEALLFFSLHTANLHFFISDCPSFFDYDNFRSHFNGFIRANALEELLLQDQIDSYINELENYILFHEDYTREFDFEYDFSLHCETQALITMFQNLSKITNITEITEEGNITFNSPLTNDIIMNNLDTNNILLLANSFVINYLNTQLRDIFPEI